MIMLLWVAVVVQCQFFFNEVTNMGSEILYL